MKKCLALLLCTVLVLSLGGFTAKETAAVGNPAKIYREALDKSLQGDAVQVNTAIDTAMKGGGLTISLRTNATIQMKGEGDRTQFSIVISTALPDGEEKLGFYYKGGYLYLDGGPGAKLKVRAPMEAAGMIVNEFCTPTAPTDALKNATVKQVDGNTVITYKVGATELQAAAGDVLAALRDALREEGLTNVKPLAITGSVTIDKDGRIAADRAQVKFSAVVEGQTAVCTSTMTSTYPAVGEDFAVQFPADLASYQEMSDLPAA